MSNNNISPLGWAVLIAVVCAFIGQLLSGNNTATTTTTYTPSAPSSSAEQRYVEQRFRQEGFSASESATAAEAVLKFQRAQEARKR